MVEPDALQRFVTAQDAGGTYCRAVAELTRGRKTSHWMWFVFPQIAGLGRSAMAQRYAIGDLAQARAYLAHPVLGPRLAHCARTVLGTAGTGTDPTGTDPAGDETIGPQPAGPSAEEIFGGIDAVKLRSSMTMFAAADPDQLLFRRCSTASSMARRIRPPASCSADAAPGHGPAVPGNGTWPGLPRQSWHGADCFRGIEWGVGGCGDVGVAGWWPPWWRRQDWSAPVPVPGRMP